MFPYTIIFFQKKAFFSNLSLGVTHTMVVFKTETTTINNLKIDRV